MSLHDLMASEALWASVIGALVGSATAAIPAYLLARKTSVETLERDRISRSEAQRLATLRAFIKIQRIVNGIETLHRGIEGMIEQANAKGHRGWLWQKVMPMTGFTSDLVRFEADEVLVFVSRDAEYLNDLLLAAERYNALQSSFVTYGERRTLLTDQLPVQQMQGQQGTTNLTPEEAARFQPKVVELESLVEQLRAMALSDYIQTLSLAERFGPKARNYLDDPTFPVLAFDETRARRPSNTPEET